MTSGFRATVRFDGGGLTRAVYESVLADARFHPGGPASVRVSMDGEAVVEVDAGQLPHLRAALNSALRLLQAAHGAIGPAKV